MAYFLCAQLDPRSNDLFADKEKELSLCRDEKAIHIYRDFGSVYELESDELSKVLSAKIGGMFGLGG